jgi:hypothetical protein
MCLLDERILERLDEEGDAVPWEIAFDISLTTSSARVEERCWILTNAEFVYPFQSRLGREHTEIGFSITCRGLAYLAGQVNADLVRPLPAPRPSYATRPEKWAGF